MEQREGKNCLQHLNKILIYVIRYVSKYWQAVDNMIKTIVLCATTICLFSPHLIEFIKVDWTHSIKNDVIPDSKVHVAHMGPTWFLSAPGGPHVGPINLPIWHGMWNDCIRFPYFSQWSTFRMPSKFDNLAHTVRFSLGGRPTSQMIYFVYDVTDMEYNLHDQYEVWKFGMSPFNTLLSFQTRTHTKTHTQLRRQFFVPGNIHFLENNSDIS